MKKYKNPEMLSSVIYFLSHCLHSSLRIQKFQHPAFDIKCPAIYCFWHGHLYLPIIAVKKMLNHPAAGFVSYSKDGEILARWLEKIGYSVVRGSSSKKGFAGMIKLLHLAKQGFSFGIAPDGPRGPLHQIGPGLAFLAAKSKLPIVPVGVHYSNAKIFDKSWDKFVLPKPFSKAIIYFAEPITIQDPEQSHADSLKNVLLQAGIQAKQCMESPALNPNDAILVNPGD